MQIVKDSVVIYMCELQVSTDEDFYISPHFITNEVVLGRHEEDGSAV